MPSAARLNQQEILFSQEVEGRFQLYDSLFLTLPFYQVKDTGILLPFFSAHCEKETAAGQAPADIIESFFKKYAPEIDRHEQINRLFRFIQYIERQVVLFDAIEDSSFDKLSDLAKSPAAQNLLQPPNDNTALQQQIKAKLKDFTLRLVLTAHPTQFYPGTVLGIITDLVDALKINDINSINLLLQQLGKTPFFNKRSPTPVDEAVSLIWFLENVFYQTVSDIQADIEQEFDLGDGTRQIMELGFWPGGDRDGNPNVHADTTKTVAASLRRVIFRCYYRDFRSLKRRITFRGVEDAMAAVEKLLYENAFDQQKSPVNVQQELLSHLEKVQTILKKDHDGLFADMAKDLSRKVRAFGCYFATLDIRQDSRILRDVFIYCTELLKADPALATGYQKLNEEGKLAKLTFNEADITAKKDAEKLITDTLETIRLMKILQQTNGEKACQRFIISNCQQASDILQLIDLFLWCGWKKEELTIDFVPLFETVNDLSHAADVMERLYNHQFYKEHVKLRENRQIIMLGFSDSTKDGGYLMANWSIYKAKVALTATARKYGIDLVFFDGRGGPPARGGGKTHRFYASMGKDIANQQIQLTIQGQTVSSQYGSPGTARFNSEQLINAGITSALNPNRHDLLDSSHKKMISEMADASYQAFVNLREDPLFIEYLEKMSPLKLLSQVNISSRPMKRNADAKLKLEDLRAISFVTSWGQMKQNIPGFYGVGTALKNMKEKHRWTEVQELYNNSGYFKTVVDNCMMSMSKSDFRVTAYLANDKTFGKFWIKLKDEFELSKMLLLELTGNENLMEEYPIEKRSIALRERIVLPLVIIQHYALYNLRNSSPDDLITVYNKLIIRTVYGIVNAGRNSA